MKLTLKQAKYILNAVTLYEWDRGPLDKATMTTHQQCWVALNSLVHDLERKGRE